MLIIRSMTAMGRLIFMSLGGFVLAGVAAAQATCSTVQRFSTAGTTVCQVAANVNMVTFAIFAGGGGGGGGAGNSASDGGSGGTPGNIINFAVDVTPGEVITVEIGKGGAGGAGGIATTCTNCPAGTGGTGAFTRLQIPSQGFIQLFGGTGGTGATRDAGGNGGTGTADLQTDMQPVGSTIPTTGFCALVKASVGGQGGPGNPFGNGGQGSAGAPGCIELIFSHN